MRPSALSLLLCLAAPAWAADFYVDPVNGSDTGDGSAANPWRTLQAVVDADLIETRNFGPAWDVTFERSDIFTVADPSSWTEADWVNVASSGVSVGADRVTVRDCRVRNVRFGISVSGAFARIQRNLVDGFSADGVRGLGNDGLFVGWVVENNVVVTDHWHGISFLGMRDSRIVNNTVIDLDQSSPGPPWIMVAPHKDGRPSQNVVVRNNLATDYSLEGTSIVADHNLEITDAAALFVAPPYNLHLRPGTAAVDTGSAALAPSLDVEGIRRPQGAGVDLGAFERCPDCRPCCPRPPRRRGRSSGEVPHIRR